MVLVTLLFANLLIGVIIDGFSAVSELAEKKENASGARGGVAALSTADFQAALQSNETGGHHSQREFVQVTLPDDQRSYVTVRRKYAGSANTGGLVAEMQRVARSQSVAARDVFHVVRNTMSNKSRRLIAAVKIQRTFRARRRMLKRKYQERLASNQASGRNLQADELLRTSSGEPAGWAEQREKLAEARKRIEQEQRARRLQQQQQQQQQQPRAFDHLTHLQQPQQSTRSIEMMGSSTSSSVGSGASSRRLNPPMRQSSADQGGATPRSFLVSNRHRYGQQQSGGAGSPMGREQSAPTSQPTPFPTYDRQHSAPSGGGGPSSYGGAFAEDDGEDSEEDGARGGREREMSL